MPSRIPRPNRADTELAEHRVEENKENSSTLRGNLSQGVDQGDCAAVASGKNVATTMSERQALRPAVRGL